MDTISPVAENEPKASEISASNTSKEQPNNAEKKKGIQLSESIKKSLDSAESCLDRAKKGLALMQDSIEAQPQRFAEFWEIRAIVVQALQEPQIEVPADVAAKLQELSQKARELKDQQEAQSAEIQKSFEEALTLLEIDCAHIEEAVRACEALEAWPASLQEHIAELTVLQPQAAVLSSLANRLTDIRQRVLKAHIRTRSKNVLLARIAKAGDQVFPMRKEQGARLSQLFEQAVDSFLAENFAEGQLTGPINTTRDEIKALQAVAKQLYLPMGVFSRQRQKLGDAWEALKKFENSRKKERQQRGQQVKELVQSIEERLTELQAAIGEACQGIAVDDKLSELRKALRELLRSALLKRDQVQRYRERIKELEQPLEEKHQTEKQAKKRASQAKEEAYQQRVEQQYDALQKLTQEIAEADPAQGLGAVEHFMEQLAGAALLSADRDKIRMQAATLKDPLLGRLLNSEAAEHLPQAVEALRKRKGELKSSIDMLRRERGAGSNDLSKGLYLDEVLREEKQRLDQIIDLLYQGERRLYDLQSG